MLRLISVSNRWDYFSEIASESAQALEAQRYSLAHEAWVEMTRRDTRQEQVLSHLWSEL